MASNDPSVPREPKQILQVMGTIWHDTNRLQCPVCASPMRQPEPYNWFCGTEYCPIEEVTFNDRVHNYGVAENAPSDPR